LGAGVRGEARGWLQESNPSESHGDPGLAPGQLVG